MADPKYGEDQSFVAQQKGAPLAEAAGPPPGPYPSDLAASMGGGGAPGQPAPAPPRDVVGFGAPTQRPNEPVTTGSPLGAGHGPLKPRGAGPGQLSAALADYFAADDTGILQEFAWQLSEMGI